MRYARDEAVRLLEWLLPQLHGDESLAVELPFRNVRHKADVAIISPSRLYALEIKGPRDNVGTLKAQVSAYQQMFLEVTIAVAARHLMFATNELPSAVGLILLDRNSVVEVRKPQARKLLKKEFSLAWLKTSEISRLVGSSVVRSEGIEGARAFAAKLFTSEQLTQFTLHAVAERNLRRHQAFLAELGESVTLDDVQMLSLPQRVRR
jgi:hypothetical protein